MAPRALGALLAIVAAIAFVVSVASSSWWSGHPDVAGRTITAKTVRVGLLGATGCNTGGDGTCEAVEITSGMQTAGLIELVAIGVTTLLAFMLAVSAWRVGDRRKTLANLVIVTALLTTIGAVGVLLLGPALHASQTVSVPIGWGTFVFAGGLLAALVASAITRTLEVEPFRLKSSAYVALPIAPSVREILRDQHDGLRPTQLGPEPVMGSGPAHMIPSRASAPLIGGAPQLRPLYDPANDGYIPAPVSPPLPMSPPTPLPQSMIDQIRGNMTPQPDARPPARQHLPSTPPPPARGHLPSTPPPGRAHSASAPPPPGRAHSASAPPPPGRAHSASAPPPPGRAQSASAPPPLRGSRPSVPPPAGQPRPGVPMPARPASPTGHPVPSRPQPGRAQTVAGHGTDPALRVATPPSGAKMTAPSSTLAHAVPPMPTPENTPAPSREGRAKTEADDRLDKAMRPTDYITAVEIDADAKAAAAAQLGDVTETNLRIEAQRVPNTDEDSVISAPPTRDGTGLQHGEVLSSIQKPITLELAAQNVLTDGDPASAKQRALAPPGLTGLTSVQSMPPSRITHELGAQTVLGAGDPFANDSAVQQGGVTQEMSAQRMTADMLAAEPLTDQLARQQHTGGDTDEQGPHGTDRTHQPDDSVPLTGPSGTDVTRRPANRSSQTPISTHAPRGADHTPIPTHAPSISTAPTNLAPPKPSEAVASGPTPGCPQCESPMAWVEEHLRFYCKQCRMYF